MLEVAKMLKASVLPLASAMTDEIKTREGAAQGSEEAQEAAPPAFSRAFEMLTPEHHMRCMCTFHAAQDLSSVEVFAALASARCSQHGDTPSQSGQALISVAPLLRAASALAALDKHGETQSEVFKAAAVELKQRVPVAAEHRLVGELLEDVALALWCAARPLLDGVACMRDREAGLVAFVLEALHAVFEVVQQDDEVLRCATTE
jgi:hypothetical protein